MFNNSGKSSSSISKFDIIEISESNNSNNLPAAPASTKKVALWKQPHRTRRILARTANASSTASSANGNNGAMVYNCDVCGKAFGYLFSMKKHREKHAPFIAGGSFQPSFAGEEHHLCVQCNRLFSCYASLKRHQLTTHTENGPVFHCPYCPYSNPFSWQVKRHIYKRHGHEESFFCGGCKKFFRTDVERDRHVCSAPSSRFKQSSNNQHQQQSSQQVHHAAGINNHEDDEGQQSSFIYDDNEMTLSNKADEDHEDEEEEDELISVDDDNNHGGGNNSNNGGGVVSAANSRPIDDCPMNDIIVAASANGHQNNSQSDTPCICSECGTCLPCFEAMMKHQSTHHPHRGAGQSQHHDESPTPLISSSRLNRQQPYISSSGAGNNSNSGCFPPSAVRTNGFQVQAQDDQKFSTTSSSASRFNINNNRHHHHHRQSPPLSAAASNNLLMVNEPGVSYSSPASAAESSSSSPGLNRSATNQHPFECSFCGISFSDPALWGLHTTMHDVNDLRKCNFCGRQAKDKYDFWRHFIDHNKVPTVSSLSTPPVSSNSAASTSSVKQESLILSAVSSSAAAPTAIETAK